MFIDVVRDIEIQKPFRLSRSSRIEEALARALENGAAEQVSRTYLTGHLVKTFLK